MVKWRKLRYAVADQNCYKPRGNLANFRKTPNCGCGHGVALRTDEKRTLWFKLKALTAELRIGALLHLQNIMLVECSSAAFILGLIDVVDGMMNF